MGSISLGSPIFFRDIDVGTVLGWDLGDLASTVTIHAFVRAPFDQYVREDSSFWNASGLSVKLSGDGISVQMESLRALILGGIAFYTPRESKEPIAKAYQDFSLYPSFEAAKSAGFGHQLQLGDPHMGATIATVMFLIILTVVSFYLLVIQRRMRRYQF